MTSRWLGAATHLLIVTLALLARADNAPSSGSPSSPKDRWCAPELTALTDTVCFYSPEEQSKATAGRRTLVIFLHSLIGQGTHWAWDQQRLMKRHADTYGFSALIPRGRPGLGPGRDPAVLAWPTAKALQEKHEDSLIAEWASARRLVEEKAGSFDRVFVFGFSNGAYYATSLAMRGRLDVDGYGVFAGGTGGKYHRLLAARAERRIPIFVGYGTKDPDHARQEKLVKMLRDIGWPHQSRADRVGHTVSHSQMRDALAFLRQRTGADEDGQTANETNPRVDPASAPE